MTGLKVPRARRARATLAAALFLAGCATTSKPGPNIVERVEGQSAPTVEAPPGFFGNDASLLKPGTGNQANLIYINPNVQWKKYDKIMLEPVEFWDAANSSVSPGDQHMLTAFLYNKLKEDLTKNFTLVDQAAPGTIVVQVAIINASGATPGLRSVSLVVPQIRLLNAVQSLATGSYAFVGSAEGAMKFTDAQTGELLAAAVDQREGGTSVKAAAQWQWGDAEAVMTLWATTIADRLAKATGKIPPDQSTSSAATTGPR